MSERHPPGDGSSPRRRRLAAARRDADIAVGGTGLVRLVPFLWRYVRPYWPWAIVAVVAVVTFAVTTGALASLVEPIFSEVLLSESGMGAMGLPGGGGGEETPAGEGGEVGEGAAVDPAGDLLGAFDVERQLDRAYEGLKAAFQVTGDDVVWFVPLLMVAVFTLRALASFISGYSFQRIGLGVTTDMRNDLYWRILNQSSRFHARHASGELVSRVVNDVALMQSAVSNRLLDLFQQSLTLLFLILLLLSTHLQLALISLVVAPALLVPIVRFGQGMRRTSHRSQERMAELAALMTEGVRGNRVVKAFGMEDFEQDRFVAATGRHLRVNLRAQLISHLSSPVVETIAVVGGAAFLIYAGDAVRSGTLTAGVLVGFLAKLIMMYDPIRKLNKVNLILQESLAAVYRVAGVMAEPNDVRDRPGAKAIDGVSEAVRFVDVTFSYADDTTEDEDVRPVLEGIDLDVPAGTIVALVGPSGAGKSTLVNLLPRFFDPDRGRVEIDGRDIRDLTLSSLREQIGLVTQETTLFNDTVRANIAYGHDEMPMERVREAAAAAYADDFVMAMPDGYDTVVGEGGLRLSGGQRQRLAIARALLKNAPILILDEATSQLDSESEALVQKALTNLMEGRTTLVIAHRLSTVQTADRIVVLEAGQIVEEGTHAELLALDGAYKRLHDLQFKV